MSPLLPRDLTRWQRRRGAGIAMAASVACVSIVPYAHAQNKDTKDGRSIEEVIVTAQKREERLQDVPISITVMSGDELDASTSKGITDELNSVPGVTATAGLQSGGTQLTVRGVTAGSLLFTGSSPVAYYLDSVPFGLIKSALVPDPNAYDMQRIEVLRGPQGTLYGASALNGVIRVLTAEANPDEIEFKARTMASSTDGGGENYRGDVALNVPIVQGKLAARAVLGYQDYSGWIDRPTREDANDAEIRNGRFKIAGQPTDQLSIGLSAWISSEDYGAPANGDDLAHNPARLDESISVDYGVYGAKIVYEFDTFSISSMTSYLEYSNDSALDYEVAGVRIPGTRLQTNLDSEVVSEEVILSSTGAGPWQWSVGGMYRTGEDRLFQFRQQYLAPTDLSDESESFALFGQLTRLFFDGKLELTGGVRYFEDDVTQTENSRLTAPPASALIRDNTRTFDNVSPRVALTWHPSDTMTGYVSYAEGFRSGFNQNGAVIATAPQFPPLDADTLKNYEIGLKGSLGSVFGYDLAVYYIDWQDVQQTLAVNVGTITNPVDVTALVNGESASGLGADAALTAQPLEGLKLALGVSWNDLTLDSTVFSSGIPLFLEGERLSMSPEYTGSASVDYAFPIGPAGWRARFSANATYRSEQTARVLFGTALIREGDDMLVSGVSVSIDTPNRWTATLFCDNVGNEDGAITGLPTVFAIPFYDLRVRPRTIGAQLEYRF